MKNRWKGGWKIVKQDVFQWVEEGLRVDDVLGVELVFAPNLRGSVLKIGRAHV